MTKEEFIKKYAERSGLTIEALKEMGRGAFPCGCGDSLCEGWQMVNEKEYLEDHQRMPELYPLEEEFCGQCGAEVLGHHACQMFQDE